MKRGAWAVLALGLLASCGNPAVRQIETSLGAAASSGDGDIIRLDTVAPERWSRLFVFGPYTSAEFIERCTGAASARRLLRGVDYLDSIHLVVVELRPTARYRSFVVPRADVEFVSNARAYGYAQDEARFVVDRASAGDRVELEPVATPSVTCPGRS